MGWEGWERDCYSLVQYLGVKVSEELPQSKSDGGTLGRGVGLDQCCAQQLPSPLHGLQVMDDPLQLGLFGREDVEPVEVDRRAAAAQDRVGEAVLEASTSSGCHELKMWDMVKSRAKKSLSVWRMCVLLSPCVVSS